MRLLPERRQRVRIVTLKNAVWVLVGLVLLFMGFSTWNELRPGDPARERLSDRGGSSARPAARATPAGAAEELPISDQTFSHREGGHALTPPPPTAAPAPAPRQRAAAPVPEELPRRVTLNETRRRGDRIVISGGAEGVRVDTAPAPPPETEPPVIPPDGL